MDINSRKETMDSNASLFVTLYAAPLAIILEASAPPNLYVAQYRPKHSFDPPPFDTLSSSLR